MATKKTSRFASTDVRFADTRGAGGITIRGFELETDEDGFITAPASIEADVAPHGFMREGSPAHEAWKAARPKAAAKAAEAKK